MAGSTQGGCQCGAIRYSLHGVLGPAYACHCHDCQKQSASAFSLSIPLARYLIEFSGALVSFERRADSGAVTTCYFCKKCGSRLYHQSSRSPEVITLKVGTLDETYGIAPVTHMWVSRKQSWVVLDPSVPAFATQPPDLNAWRASLMNGP